MARFMALWGLVWMALVVARVAIWAFNPIMGIAGNILHVKGTESAIFYSIGGVMALTTAVMARIGKRVLANEHSRPV